MYESIPHLITQPPDTASTVTLRGWPGFWASGASAKKDLFRISVHICICAVVVFYPRATRAHGRGVISSTNTSGRRLPDYLQICILVYMYTHHVNVIHICTHKLS